MKIIKIISAVGFFLATVGLLSGCGTVSGFGKDVAKTGRVIQKAAR